MTANGFLALQILDRIIGREDDLDLASFVGLGADELIFKPRDQLTRAELDRHVLALAAFKRGSIHFACEIHDHKIADPCGMLLGCVFPTLALDSELIELRIEVAFVDIDRQSIELKIIGLGRWNIRQRLEAHRDFSILARLIFLVEFDLGLKRGTNLLLLQELLHTVLHSTVERVALKRVPMHLFDQVGRHLARTEAGHPDLRRNSLHFLVHPRLDVLGGNGQHEGALEALVFSLDCFDRHVGKVLMKLASEVQWNWCGRRDSNPHIFRYWNLNPARLPIPPRPRGRLKAGRPITGLVLWATRQGWQPTPQAGVPEHEERLHATRSAGPRKVATTTPGADPTESTGRAAARDTSALPGHRCSFSNASGN